MITAANTVSGNVTLEFGDGGLVPSVRSCAVNISPLNKVTPVYLADQPLKVTLTPATGLIAGTFLHTNKSILPFYGVILQRGAGAGAYGYFMTTQPTVPVGSSQSGGVTLIAK